MKKLMLAAAAVAIAGAASAVQVYTYKASVKHTYLKIKTVNALSLYVRYTKNTTIDGYLVQDDRGVLTTGTITANDPQPRNRCFLVAKNKSPEKKYKYAAILPGVLDVKWYDDKLTTASSAKPVQGYLYLGGETVTDYGGTGLIGTTFNAADIDLAPYTARTFANWSRQQPVAKAVHFAIDDYWFTSAYLFGQYNQPSWAGTGVVEEFGDTWMNHAGFGKMLDDSDACCGDTSGGRAIDTLSGGVKVGIWLCTEVGDDKNHGDPLGVVRAGVYEDQLWLDVNANDPGAWNFYNIGVVPTAKRILDMWGDGNLSLGTTDVGYGTFSIKRTTRKPFEGVKDLATVDTTATGDEADITGAWAFAAPTGERLKILRVLKTALGLLKTDTEFLGDPTSKEVNGLINASFYDGYLK